MFALLRPFISYFRPYRLQLIPVAIGCAIEVAFNAQIPLSVKFLIDKAVVAKDQRIMFEILGALAVGAVVVSVTSLGRDYLYARIVNKIVSDLRIRMFDRLQQLSMDYYARVEVGDLMSRFSNDIASMQRGLSVAISWGLQPLMDLILLSILVFVLEWRLAIIGFVLCSLVVAGPQLFSGKTAELSLGKQEEESRIMVTLQETISAPALIRAFNLQERTSGLFRERNRVLLGAAYRLSFLTSLMDRSTSVATLLLQVIVMGFSGYMAFRGLISVGTFASFQGLFLSLSFAFAYLAQYMPQLINSSGGVTRIQEFLDEKPKVADEPGARPLPPLTRAIELSGVTFRYAGADLSARPNLANIDLGVAQGSKVALVGPSGSGKSTVLNLILRFYDPSEGALLFDGMDVRKASQASLREQMAVVFQESFLFNTTIRENIALGKPDATDEEIVAAARAAEIHEFISTLPDGYQTLAGERGARFSGGQRQRIAIARAVLKNPSILLLDEATSALDADTEHAINTTLERVAQGRTMVSVTHRLRSVVTMDKVYVLDKGYVIEQGNHSELLEKGGTYAKMWQKQSGVRLEDGGRKASVDVAWLAELPLFQGVRKESLAEIAKWFGTENYAEDRVVVQEGEPGASFYILVRGTLEVSRLVDGQARQIAKLQDGDCFGEMALLSNKPRNATIRTLTPCVCLSLQRDLFEQLLEREPQLQSHVRAISERRASAGASEV